MLSAFISVSGVKDSQICRDKCLDRGLNEELGVLPGYVQERKFYNFFLWKRHFEVGVSALVELDLSLNDLEYAYENAKDRTLETTGLRAVDFNVRALSSFLEENRGNMTELSIHVLRSLVKRE
jgi:hypothetical protein